MVCDAIEQRCGHFGISEDLAPFAEARIGGGDDAGAFVEAAEQMEQQGAS